MPDPDPADQAHDLDRLGDLHAGPDAEPDSDPGVEPTPDPGAARRRLTAALFRPGRRQLVVAVLLAVVGFSATTQVRANSVDDTYSGYREQDLVDVLTGLAGTSQRAQAEIERLEQTRRQLESDTSARQAALDQATSESDTLGILAGQVPVSGPGIRVTITEVDGSVQVDTFVDMIQELRNAGAESIQINGSIRVIAQTSFEAGQSGLVVDGRQLTAPYVVDAIGEPDTLADSGMDFPDGPTAQLQDDGAQVAIERLQSLDITSTVRPVQPDHAQPSEPQPTAHQ